MTLLAWRLTEAYSQYFVAQEHTPSPLFDGVMEALTDFRQAGYQLAVATGKSRRGLDRVLKSHDLTNFFDVTRCADARVRAVAVSYGAQSREHLLQSRPEHCIDAFSEFHPWVMSGVNSGPVSKSITVPVTRG